MSSNFISNKEVHDFFDGMILSIYKLQLRNFRLQKGRKMRFRCRNSRETMRNYRDLSEESTNPHKNP